MRNLTRPILASILLLAAAGMAEAQTQAPAADPNMNPIHRPASTRQGRSVGYETWGGGYRRWSYGNFGTCTNVQLAAGMCPSYYKR